MILSELMKEFTPDPDYKGAVMADDYVLAVNTGKEDEAVGNYAVVQEYIEGVDSSINSESTDKQYIRGGKSTTKKANQRTFSVTGDKYIGDEAQDFFEAKKYATGQDAITDYVYFNLKNGKGEKGKVTIAVDKDGGGNAGDNAGISVTLSKNGAAPEDYTWGEAAQTENTDTGTDTQNDASQTEDTEETV